MAAPIKLKYSTGSTSDNPQKKRSFDILYLFDETVMEMMVEQGCIKPIEKLSHKEYAKAMGTAMNIWNDILTVSERHSFDRMSQKRLEAVFRDILSGIDFQEIIKYPNEIHAYRMTRISGVDRAYKEKLSGYVSHIQDRFEYEAARWNLDTAFIKGVYKRLRNPDDSSGEGLLMEALTSIVSANTKAFRDEASLHKMNGLVRELQALVNHTVYEKNGKISSRFLSNITDTKELFETDVPTDLGGCISLVIDAHTEIANLIREYDALIKQKKTEWLGRMEELKIKTTEEDVEYAFPPIHIDTVSILHHMLDWYAMTYPWALQKRNARQIAVMMYAIFEELHERMFAYGENPIRLIEKSYLTTFGGWKSASPIRNFQIRSTLDFLDGFSGDPHLLFVESHTLPENWEEVWGKMGGYYEEEEL